MYDKCQNFNVEDINYLCGNFNYYPINSKPNQISYSPFNNRGKYLDNELYCKFDINLSNFSDFALNLTKVSF